MASRVRQATAGDAARVRPLLEQLGYPRSERSIAADLAGGGETILVAEDGQALVGLAAMRTVRTLTHDRPVTRLTALVVDTGRRGSGVGETLLRAVVERAREAGSDGVELTSGIRPERAGAHRFYERRGFLRRSYGFWLPFDEG